MNNPTSFPISEQMARIMNRVKEKQNEIQHWLESYEGSNELPLYSSVDIRDAGFKMAVVDTNIFPAGFNNLCEHGLEDSIEIMRKAILKRVPNCNNILIIAEEHTRNTWYLENIRILQEIITKAGFQSKIATFLSVEPSFCEKARFIELETATGKPVRIYCFKKILEDYEAGIEKYCLIILNNDLTTGIPEILSKSEVPIYPSIQAGWHSRLKSHHFDHTKDLMTEFAKVIDVDPWLLTAHHAVVDHVNINEEADRQRLKTEAENLFAKIQQKYDEHSIKEKPFIFLKADAGTYGMGVLPIESPEDILELNRKNRNKLYKGKSSVVIGRFLLQEGIPTIYHIGNEICEVCIYQIENQLVGGFYRSHSAKSDRDNLNSTGMTFKKMCPHLEKYGQDCGVPHNFNLFDVYRVLARIAGIAAHREIINLEEGSRKKESEK